jgi:hypothetical protein
MLALMGLAPATLAQAPEQSIRPLPRPGPAVPAPVLSAMPAPPAAKVPDAAAAPLAEPFVFAHPDTRFDGAAPRPRRAAPADGWAEAAPLPRPRPRPDAAASAAQVAAAPAAGLGAVLLAALRPEPRPRGLARRAAPEPEAVEPAAVIRPAPGTGPLVSRRGSVCGVPGIQGETIAPIVGRVRGCGVANPVRITSVDGVRLSQPSIMDCDTAKALNTWVQRGLQPAFGGQVTGLQVAGHYVCRTRNHKRGARLSEHSRGRAIDISGVTLTGGQTLTISRDWRGRQGRALKAAHKAACGTFGTTLGPGSDGMHEDHLHFDTARHRNGPYCR